MKRRVIDADKLKKELQKRGLTANEAGLGLGYCKSYVATCIKDGLMAQTAINLLELKYNIKYEDIAPDEQEKKEPDPAEKKVADAMLTTKAVEEGVYRALMRALPSETIKKALVECLPDLEKAMERAFREALK